MALKLDGSLNVLFTSAGRRVELLRACRQAYRDLDLQGRIVISDIDPLAPSIHEADAFYMVPPFTSPDYIPSLVEICLREKIDLVLPLIDPDIPILARHRDAIEATGSRVGVVSVEAVETTRDKWLTSAFFLGLGLHAPVSWLPGQLDPETARYPLFIKPRRGSAANHTFAVRNARELAFFSEYVSEPVIQEKLPGPEITTDLVCDLEGRVLSVVSRRRIEVRWGEVVKGVTMYDPAITEACVKIAAALPAVGPITVQCMMKGDVPYFTEINARLGGGFPLAIAAGADPLRLLLATVAGVAIDLPPLGSYLHGLYATRFDDSFFITGEDYSRIELSRL